MKLQNKFSDSEFWKNVVQKTYPLLSREITFGTDKILLSGTKNMMVNSPYITDGGKLDESASLSFAPIDSESKRRVRQDHPVVRGVAAT